MVLVLYGVIPSFRAAVLGAVAVLSSTNVAAAREYLSSFGMWAPVVSLGMMVLQAIVAPIPGAFITLANAGLFGWVKGAVLSWSGAMAGAAICFGLSRYWGRSAVERLIRGSSLQKADRFLQEHGRWAVLIARLLPIVSFDLVSYAAGLSGMGFWGFFWATGIGQLPFMLLASYLGDRILLGSIRHLVFLLLTMTGLAVGVIFFRRYGRKRKG